MADDEFSVSDLSLTLPVEAVDELQALEAIYDTRLTAYSNSASNSADVVYLLLNTCLPSSPADPVSLVISLSKHYPFQAAPQLQLANTFLSSFAVPDELFASVLTTYMHEKGHGGVSWNGAECLYDGIEWVRNMCDEWVRKKTNEVQLRDRQLKADKPAPPPPLQQEPESSGKPTLPTTEHEENVECPPIYSCEPIIDRKSVFVGHAARVNSHDQVKAVIDTLLSNNKIAKATQVFSRSPFQFFPLLTVRARTGTTYRLIRS